MLVGVTSGRQCVPGITCVCQVAAAVSKIIAEVGLTEKVNVQSHALSGGMKRKLSVAIALIGDSKVVFLGTRNCQRGGVCIAGFCVYVCVRVRVADAYC